MIESQTHHQAMVQSAAALQHSPPSGDADILQALFAEAVYLVFNRELLDRSLTPRICRQTGLFLIPDLPQATGQIFASSRKLRPSAAQLSCCIKGAATVPYDPARSCAMMWTFGISNALPGRG